MVLGGAQLDPCHAVQYPAATLGLLLHSVLQLETRHCNMEPSGMAWSQLDQLGTSQQCAVSRCNTRTAECSRSQPSPCGLQLATAAAELVPRALHSSLMPLSLRALPPLPFPCCFPSFSAHHHHSPQLASPPPTCLPTHPPLSHSPMSLGVYGSWLHGQVCSVQENPAGNRKVPAELGWLLLHP